MSFSRVSVSSSSHWGVVVVLGIVNGRTAGQPGMLGVPLAQNASTSATAILLGVNARQSAESYENHGSYTENIVLLRQGKKKVLYEDKVSVAAAL